MPSDTQLLIVMAACGFVYLVGMGMIFTGCLRHRRPGVGLWAIGPLWKADEYLLPRGAALWRWGTVVSFVGIAFCMNVVGAVLFLEPFLAWLGAVVP